MAVEILDLHDAEAIEHFRRKGYRIGFDWRDTAAAEHARAFTVAKAMDLDILRDIRSAFDRAYARGDTVESFIEGLAPELQRKGWWGRKFMVDPRTGDIRTVQLGSVHRLRLIFDANMRSATARGHWERIERLKDRLPFLRYVAVVDERTRPEHKKWHGTILPVDHPFWATHYPPNGWRCRCMVQQLAKEDLERFGYKPSAGPPPDADKTRPWTNKRTGETAQVPLGIDPGWQHNAGLVEPLRSPPSTGVVRPVAGGEPMPSVVEGRDIRHRLLRASGFDPDDPGFDPTDPGFAAALLTTLRRELADRGIVTGNVAPTIVARSKSKADRNARDAVDAAVRDLPDTWIAAGNRADDVIVKAKSKRETSLGQYRPARKGEPPMITTDATPGNALHEYLHHLQATMPGLDRLFQNLHKQRNRGRARAPLKKYGGVGRTDEYIDEYFGREYDDVMLRGAGYDPASPALEVITRAFQLTFHDIVRMRRDGTREELNIARLYRDDPEMLDLVLSVLFHHIP